MKKTKSWIPAAARMARPFAAVVNVWVAESATRPMSMWETASFVICLKNDGRREPFDRRKILAGLKMACTKRPISAETIEQMVDNIENHLQAMAESEINSTQIGELAMRQLHQVDEVAYIRFASVYRKFTEIKEFLSEITARSSKTLTAEKYRV